MMPAGTRIHRNARLIAQVLVLVILAISPRALFTPTQPYTKAKDSKRPKAPKNVVRAEPLRIAAQEKQTPEPDPKHPALTSSGLETGARFPLVHALPRKAFTQLTRPDYLDPSGSGSPPIPLAPPS